MDGPLTFVVAIAVALVATPVAARVAIRTGVLDRPGALKVQDRPVPYLGGVAVFVASAAAALGGGVPVKWIVPGAIALALGLVDDIASISARIRLAGEMAIGIVAGLLVPAPGPAGVAVTAIAVVALINAVNLLDGLDGLASGVVLASAAGFAAVGGPGFPLAVALAGALLGFLWFNRPPARIYLGDSGSYFLGATLGVLATGALEDADTGAVWVIVPLLVAVPLADTAIAIIRRARARRPIFEGDRSHVYDQLVDRGRSRGQAVLCCIAAQVVLAAAGVVLWELAAEPDRGALAAAISLGIIVSSAATAFALGFAAPTRESTEGTHLQ
ncbi:MAG TPA: MraY family glycosyltransferase [Acidimicrobiia bacterium]|nr:MraY family glycosyltransferase [Acidimicrobiia bacterium]